MRAIRIHGPAGISGLVCKEAPDAAPGLDDVLVKVAACRGRGADRQIWRGDLRAAVARSDQRKLCTR
jgi:NADPH:quinone reductase-like Zn-dependent oxidoreductase